MKKPRGGARPGAGRKAGGQNAATKIAAIEKEAIRERVRQKVAARLDALLDAQLDNAHGIKHLMMRDAESGKFERVAVDAHDPQVAAAQIDAALKTGKAFWIYTKDPSVQAFTDLMNRTIDKPAEQEQAVTVDATVQITWQS